MLETWSTDVKDARELVDVVRVEARDDVNGLDEVVSAIASWGQYRQERTRVEDCRKGGVRSSRKQRFRLI